MSDDTESVSDRFGIDGAVVERAAERADLPVEALVDSLDRLHAELVGWHSTLERTTEYVTIDGVRAYRVEAAVWDEFLAGFGFREEFAAAVREAHTEQARRMFAKSVTGDDTFDPDEAAVVVSMDTAEQF